MKSAVKIIALLLLSLVSVGTKAQEWKIYRQITGLLENQHLYLNGSARASTVGGKTRATLGFTVPPKTVALLVSIQTAENQNSLQPLQLVGQLTRLVDYTGTLVGLVSQISVPRGASPIDVFLMPLQHGRSFENKGGFNSFSEGERSNFISGVIPVSGISPGQYSIGLRNNSPFSGVYVTVEVAAIQEERRFE